MSSGSYSSTEAQNSYSDDSSVNDELSGPDIVSNDESHDSSDLQSKKTICNESDPNILNENIINVNSNIGTDLDYATLLNRREEEKMENKDLNIKYDIEAYHIDVDKFTHVEKIDKMLIMKNGSDFFVFGRLDLNSSTKIEATKRIQFDIELDHPRLPVLYGYDYINKGKTIFEIRKIDFEPFPITKDYLEALSRTQKFKIISQVLNFFNYIIKTQHSISLLTLDDICSCCFLDGESNIYFGDISFIELNNNVKKTLFSLGSIVSQILGCKRMNYTTAGQFEELIEKSSPKFCHSEKNDRDD